MARKRISSKTKKAVAFTVAGAVLAGAAIKGIPAIQRVRVARRAKIVQMVKDFKQRKVSIVGEIYPKMESRHVNAIKRITEKALAKGDSLALIKTLQTLEVNSVSGKKVDSERWSLKNRENNLKRKLLVQRKGKVRKGEIQSTERELKRVGEIKSILNAAVEEYKKNPDLMEITKQIIRKQSGSLDKLKKVRRAAVKQTRKK